MKNTILESIKESLNESEAYTYIDGANYEKYGYGEVFNSEANTDVNLILRELKRYFDESITCAEEIIRNATHDPGISDKDVEMLKFCSEKTQEMINKIDSVYE